MTKYQHYKGGIYNLLSTSVWNTETNERLAVYENSEGKTFARPYDMFFENVVVDGVEVPRFKEIMDIKNEVLNYIKSHPGTTYANLEKLFESLNYDYKGDIIEHYADYPNTVLWGGWNDEAFNILTDLIWENLITAKGTTPLTYSIDGKVPGYPIAKQARQYKKPHWFPLVFNAVQGRLNNETYRGNR